MTQEEQYIEPFKRISVEEARALIDAGGVTVVDVREGWEYANGHIPNARHVPLPRIIQAAQHTVEGDNLIFVCEGGQRSGVAAEFAAALGKERLYNLECGTSARREAALPIEM